MLCAHRAYRYMQFTRYVVRPRSCSEQQGHTTTSRYPTIGAARCLMGVSHRLSSFCNTVESGCGQISSGTLRHLLLPWESAVLPLRQLQPALRNYIITILSSAAICPGQSKQLQACTTCTTLLLSVLLIKVGRHIWASSYLGGASGLYSWSEWPSWAAILAAEATQFW